MSRRINESVVASPYIHGRRRRIYIKQNKVDVAKAFVCICPHHHQHYNVRIRTIIIVMLALALLFVKVTAMLILLGTFAEWLE